MIPDLRKASPPFFFSSFLLLLTYINCRYGTRHWVLRLGKVNQDAGAALGAKLVWLRRRAKAIRLELVFSRDELYIFHLWVDQKISVLGADGAVAAEHLVVTNIGQRHCKLDPTTVAVGLVRHRLSRGFEHCGTIVDCLLRATMS